MGHVTRDWKTNKGPLRLRERRERENAREKRAKRKELREGEGEGEREGGEGGERILYNLNIPRYRFNNAKKIWLSWKLPSSALVVQ